MRRFRFVGEPTEYQWDVLPVFNHVYDGDFKWTYQGETSKLFLQDWFNNPGHNMDWQEVHENEGHVLTQIPEPKILHKDTDLGYFAGLAMQGLLAGIDRRDIGEEKELATLSIDISKELIKQLEEQSHA